MKQSSLLFYMILVRESLCSWPLPYYFQNSDGANCESEYHGIPSFLWPDGGRMEEGQRRVEVVWVEDPMRVVGREVSKTRNEAKGKNILLLDIVEPLRLLIMSQGNGDQKLWMGGYKIENNYKEDSKVPLVILDLDSKQRVFGDSLETPMKTCRKEMWKALAGYFTTTEGVRFVEEPDSVCRSANLWDRYSSYLPTEAGGGGVGGGSSVGAGYWRMADSLRVDKSSFEGEPRSWQNLVVYVPTEPPTTQPSPTSIAKIPDETLAMGR